MLPQNSSRYGTGSKSNTASHVHIPLEQKKGARTNNRNSIQMGVSQQKPVAYEPSYAKTFLGGDSHSHSNISGYSEQLTRTKLQNHNKNFRGRAQSILETQNEQFKLYPQKCFKITGYDFHP